MLDTATVLAGVGVMCGVLVFVTTRSLRASVAFTLDLLLAAGLLRLTVLDSWIAIGSAAAIVAVRKVIGLGLTAGEAARRLAPPATRPRTG